MDKYSFLNAAGTQFFADMYERYQAYPDSVEPSWRAFFQGFDFAQEQYTDDVCSEPASAVVEVNNPHVEKEFKVLNLIEAYRRYGHFFAQTNPIGEPLPVQLSLAPEAFGLSSADMNTTFEAARTIGLSASSLAHIIAQLKSTYCGSIGVEYAHITDEVITDWFAQKLNKEKNTPAFTQEEKIQILKRLNEAVSFENFLHNKYVGQKRFSLEGNESLISGLDTVITHASGWGVEEIVIGMPHRGRLSVLANIMEKSPEAIFSEFDGKEYDHPTTFDGDVKYHLGHTLSKTLPSGKTIQLNLCPNPSHLETVGAVIQGISRAKQDLHYAGDFSKVLPIALHGDASVSGQGIVYEIAQMNALKGYHTGGTLHIVVNNQVGFTTNFTDSRSTYYCTDIAKTTSSPVLHINADDAEAVSYAFMLAVEFRQRFGKDIYIDLIGYRKYGHNEGDEPRFTQPIMYKVIGAHTNPRSLYAKKLVAEGVVSESFESEIEQAYKERLDAHLQASREKKLTTLTPFMQELWRDFSYANAQQMLLPIGTAFAKEKLDRIAQLITQLPKDKKILNKTEKIIKDRHAMYFEKALVDWGMAEHLAFATLLSEGYDVRLAGEDVERGTFSHRHAVIKTDDSEERIVPLDTISAEMGGGVLRIYNSLLSEYAALGFDYGYAMAAPNTLTIWEGQFGDFANGGQIMIDQYICCGEDKWLSQNGLVMLLPHGYEGQGAEHSSARIERYLQLCAAHNMVVANCTTPANIYHLLRRQMKANYRKPLVIFSPKSLLRHPQVISTTEELAQGGFAPVIGANADPKKVKKVVLCSGRFYYDLLDQAQKLGREDVALVRIEQLFPLPDAALQAEIARYEQATQWVWAQEEPKNMGAYGYMLMNFHIKPLTYAGMDAYAAPASGSHARDRVRHQQAIDAVFKS